jgi:hypothetical protein
MFFLVQSLQCLSSVSSSIVKTCCIVLLCYMVQLLSTSRMSISRCIDLKSIVSFCNLISTAGIVQRWTLCFYTLVLPLSPPLPPQQVAFPLAVMAAAAIVLGQQHAAFKLAAATAAAIVSIFMNTKSVCACICVSACKGRQSSAFQARCAETLQAQIQQDRHAVYSIFLLRCTSTYENVRVCTSVYQCKYCNVQSCTAMYHDRLSSGTLLYYDNIVGL